MSDREHDDSLSGPADLPLSQRLSPEGQARERAMLGQLLDHVDRTRRRRHVTQAGAGAAALVILAVTALVSIPIAPSPVPPTALRQGAPATEEHPAQPRLAPALPASSFAILSNDPTILARLTIRPAPPTLVRNLTDDQLLGEFQEAGFSVALVRIAGRLELWAN